MHVDAFVDTLSDAGSIPAASTNTQNPNPYPVGIFLSVPPFRRVSARGSLDRQPRAGGRLGTFKPRFLYLLSTRLLSGLSVISSNDARLQASGCALRMVDLSD